MLIYNQKETKETKQIGGCENMVINDLMDLIKKLFGDNYENVIIVDASDREEYEADKMTIKELKGYDINKIDVITADEDKIYIYF